MRNLVIATTILVSALPGLTQPIAEPARPEMVVGRLVLGERGFCSAVAIASDRLLTAGHCLYDKETGARIALDLMRFEGPRDGPRGITRVMEHPDYALSGDSDFARIAYDVAVLEVSEPLALVPDAVLMDPANVTPGLELEVMTYQGQGQACPLLHSDHTAHVLGCSSEFGFSGGAVVSPGPFGGLVGVIAAQADYDGKKVSLVVPLSPELLNSLTNIKVFSPSP